jgi:hypothetical protein
MISNDFNEFHGMSMMIDAQVIVVMLCVSKSNGRGIWF